MTDPCRYFNCPWFGECKNEKKACTVFKIYVEDNIVLPPTYKPNKTTYNAIFRTTK